MFGASSSKVPSRDREKSEVSLDEDQEKKYEEIVEYLVAGGYFRARIQGLSRFDKVVGGMCWCITASNEDLDVDIFFQEDASIGQRIKIGEGIIRALQRMKCPYRLEPNQIQGGANTADFVSIFPVIQWLVKKVIETREETGDLMRLYSESQFSKNHKLPEDAEFDSRKERASLFVEKVADSYKPNRKFRRGGRRVAYANKRTEEENVQSALMEYGSLGGKKAGKSEGDASQSDADVGPDMASYTTRDDVDTGVMQNLLPENLREMESQFEDGGLEGQGQDKKLFGRKLHEQNVTNLERQITGVQREIKGLEEVYLEYQQKLEEVQASYSKKLAYNQRIRDEIEKLDAMETPENTKVLQLLKSLVALNENLKSQEAAFKGNCKRQLTDLKAQIESLKAQLDTSGGNEEKKMVDEAFEADQQKLEKYRQLAAKKSRDIALVERKIDEVPSRTELTQYQRQFVELYEQMATKFTETKNYYNSYNTSESIKGILQKEISLLNSIHDGYKPAMAGKVTKEQFLEGIKQATATVLLSLEKTESQLNAVKETKAKLTEQHTALADKERLYYKMTKEFLEECKKNELLNAKLEEQ